MRFLGVLIAVGLIVGGVLLLRGPTHPRIFDARAYDEASAAATREGKLFIVKYSASWCSPCNEMDRTTLVDPAVERWLERGAVMKMVDVDAEPGRSQRVGVSAIPTMIAYRGEAEVARAEGYLSSEEMLAWLNALGAANGTK